jgi:hypothetical protein
MNRPCPLHDGDTAERTVGALGALAKSIQFPLPVAERYNPSPLGRVMSFTKKVNGTKVAQFESIGKFDTPHVVLTRDLGRRPVGSRTFS